MPVKTRCKQKEEDWSLWRSVDSRALSSSSQSFICAYSIVSTSRPNRSMWPLQNKEKEKKNAFTHRHSYARSSAEWIIHFYCLSEVHDGHLTFALTIHLSDPLLYQHLFTSEAAI
ncbi:hypothetical protein SK128_017692 [Halocaridina rubra]|uniref:Uncharacterized protein n=1 Tax=Halocaridina rubra TaxID=373956 RepID=A0AAN8WTL7_HALRR